MNKFGGPIGSETRKLKTRRKSRKNTHLSTKPDVFGRSRRRCKPIKVGVEVEGVVYWQPFNLLHQIDAEGKRLPDEFAEALRDA